MEGVPPLKGADLHAIDDLTARLADLKQDLKPDAAGRRQVIEAVRRAGAAAVPELLALLEGGTVPARCLAAELLGELRDASAVPALRAALAEGEAAVRVASGQALAALRDRAALPLLREAVRELRADEAAAEGLLAALEALPDPDGIPFLHDLLHAPEARLAAAAARALGAITTRDGALALCSVLDRHDGVRREALRGLRVLPNDLDQLFAFLDFGAVEAMEVLRRRGEEVLPWLCGHVLAGNATGRALAAELLFHLGSPVSVPALTTALVDPVKTVRLNASAALAAVGTARALHLLLRAAEYAPEVAPAADAHLVLAPNSEGAVPSLLRALEGPNRLLCRLAAERLAARAMELRPEVLAAVGGALKWKLLAWETAGKEREAFDRAASAIHQALRRARLPIPGEAGAPAAVALPRAYDGLKVAGPLPLPRGGRPFPSAPRAAAAPFAPAREGTATTTDELSPAAAIAAGNLGDLDEQLTGPLLRALDDPEFRPEALVLLARLAARRRSSLLRDWLQRWKT
jgi:HEAT repeat protein